MLRQQTLCRIEAGHVIALRGEPRGVAAIAAADLGGLAVRHQMRFEQRIEVVWRRLVEPFLTVTRRVLRIGVERGGIET